MANIYVTLHNVTRSPPYWAVKRLSAQQQLSHYISSNDNFGTNNEIRDKGNLTSLMWWNMYRDSIPHLQHLATQVLSQVVNTSSIERCWSTYSFIHNMKRNNLNVD